MKRKQSPNQRLFLLSFFEKKEQGVKEINGFVLQQHFDNNINDWIVAIYTKESYEKMQRARDNFTNSSLAWIK